jgi:hypothetical protein
MFTRCANPSCIGSCSSDGGKLFRLEFEIASTAGATLCKSVFLWLCGDCARRMKPKAEIAGDTVRVLLAAAPQMEPGRPAATAN